MTLQTGLPQTEKPHCLGGVHIIAKLPNGYSLSLINAPILHGYRFAWEVAVKDPSNDLCYTTPLTENYEVFSSDKDTLAFVERAKAWALSTMAEREA